MAGTTESSQSGYSEACPLTAVGQVACSQQTGPRGCAQSPSLFPDPGLGAEGRVPLPETAETRGFFWSLLVETFSCVPLLASRPREGSPQAHPFDTSTRGLRGVRFQDFGASRRKLEHSGACGLRACSFHTWAPGTILKYNFCGRANSSGLGLCASLTNLPPFPSLSLPFSLLHSC